MFLMNSASSALRCGQHQVVGGGVVGTEGVLPVAEMLTVMSQ